MSRTKILNISSGESHEVAVTLGQGESLAGPLFIGKDRLMFGRTTKAGSSESDGEIEAIITELLLVNASGNASSLAHGLPTTTLSSHGKLTPDGQWAIFSVTPAGAKAASYYRLRVPASP